MEIKKSVVEDVTIIELDGDIDGQTAPEAQAFIQPLIVEGSKVILDMSKVSFMSSAGLRVLLTTYRNIMSNKGSVGLIGLTGEIEETMSLTGFLRFFKTYSSLEEGLAALK